MKRALATTETAPPAPPTALPGAAAAYLVGVAGATLGALALSGNVPATTDWRLFALLALAAATAQLFVVITPRNQSYHTGVVFLAAAVFLLPPQLTALVAVIEHIPEWIKERYRWYIQAFNICNYTLSALAATSVLHRVAPGKPMLDLRWAVGALMAAGVFVAVNHSVLAVMLRLARRHSFRASGLFKADNLATDLTLVALGLAFAVIWRTNPLLSLTAAAPIILIQRSLRVPALAAQARIDAKTGLFNAAHFSSTLEHEMARAGRFQRPLSLILADLDLLRNINNTYGHLAGDAVLRGVADVFRAHLREVDVPARFGGEEFAILLPETTIDEALVIAERIRAAVAETAFHSSTAKTPIWATVSIGVAAFPRDGRESSDLIHQADIAVYRAKLDGRNRVVEAVPDDALVPAQHLALVADAAR